MKPLSCLTAFFLICAPPLYSGPGAVAQTLKPKVTIGLVVPLTGTMAYIGEQASRTAQIFVEGFNRSSQKFDLALILEDGKCGQGNAATSAAHKLIEIDKVKFIISGCSGETFQVAPIAEKARVVVMAMASNHAEISKAGDYIFRTYLDVQLGLEKLGAYLKEKGVSRLALITEDVAFTQGTKTSLKDMLADMIVFEGDFLPDSMDFREILTKSKQSKPDAYYLNCASPATCSRLYLQTRQTGIRSDLYSYFYPEFPDVAAAAGPGVEGMIYIAFPDFSANPDDYGRVMEIYASRYSAPVLGYLTRTTHVAMQAIAAGVARFGEDSTAAKDFIYSYKAISPLGEISFDHNGDIQGVNWALKRLENGQRITLK